MAQLGDVVGVGQKAHVEHQVGLDGDAVLEAEGDDADTHGRGTPPIPEQPQSFHWFHSVVSSNESSSNPQ